ncbi:MAG: NAD(P)H-hydrate dehydratase [Anaerolineaceae bacterium]|nr:NAD(P)H-hydrate dehydratase [Anaerolineaceae bacterium]
MKIVSVQQMKAIEQSANSAGMSFESMMAHAGGGVADWVLTNMNASKGVAGLVGSGNNGGDTLIALTRIAENGFRTQAFLVRPRENDPLISAYESLGGEVIDLTVNSNIAHLAAFLAPGVILLDGMLGTGFRLPLRDALENLMTQIQEIVRQQPEVQVVAVDCPSGIDCDSGEAAPQTLNAQFTLTMAAVKQGLLREPASNLTGQISLVDIGIGPIEQYLKENNPVLLDPDLIFEMLPDRPEKGHKGTFGTCLVVAGTTQYTGAAYLAGKAAYRAGCGLVNVATLPPVRDSLAGRLIEAVWTILPQNGDGYERTGAGLLQDALKNADSLVVGPGWGLHPVNSDFLEALLPLIPNDLPVVFDADGLKLLGRIEGWWQKIPAQTILTPHPGEMAQITGLSITEIQSNRWDIARQFAMKWGVTLILKGALTVIGTADGTIHINPIQDSALGTAGSGDVLTGIIGGLLAQGVEASNAALLGVWLHGRAGQEAHQRLGGPESVTALDILGEIPTAIRKTKRPVIK